MLRPTGRLLAQIVTTTLTFAMVTFTVVVVLLARGPLSLGFLSPYVATALNDDSSPLQISFSDTVLTWERKRRRLDIRIVDVIVTGADGERLAAVPQVGIKLRGSSLLKFEIEPERLVLIEPRVRIVRNEEGRLELGLGGEEEQEDLIETWFEGNWPRFTHALTQISIIDADLSFDDRVSGKLWRAPSSGLSLTRGDTGIVVELVAKMVIADRPAQIAVDALYRGRDAPVVVAVDFVNVEPAILALESGIEALSPLQALRMAVSGRLSMTLDLVRNLEEAHFNIHSGPGVLSLPDYYRTPLAITGARASGRVAGDIQTLQIEKLEIDLGDGIGATFTGVARMTEAGPDIRGKGGVVNLSTSALERFWPEGLREGARRWIVGNIRDGVCDKAGLAVDVRAAELAAGKIRDDAVVFEFQCRDVTARYWKAMPALTHARGHGRINAKELLITVQEARMGDIALAEGTIKIDMRRPKARFADITFLATGPTRSVLEILERKPLNLVRRLGLNAAGATGQASVRTRLRVPLKKGRKLSDIGYAVSASLSDFTMDEAFGTFRLDRGELQLTVAPDGVGAVGTIALNGVPASITWRHDFSAASTHPSRYGMAAVLGDREREALGLRFAPYVEGATKVELQLAKDRAGGFDVQGTADLAGARLSLAELGWEKPFGQQGAAEFAFRARPGKAIAIDR
ncbi:MAG: DUF3971 domain-containing protein, partial [Alphaproteobacteria bacterium]|nr:DUF3971 domain-containing protein [Alphaproteobacteria bacterium]